jgi:hypothetical protein
MEMLTIMKGAYEDTLARAKAAEEREAVLLQKVHQLTSVSSPRGSVSPEQTETRSRPNSISADALLSRACLAEKKEKELLLKMMSLEEELARANEESQKDKELIKGTSFYSNYVN